MEKKVIFSTSYFEVIQIGEVIGIEPFEICVAIIPYEKDEKGILSKIGILKEFNPLRDGDFSITLITGRAEGEDPDILSTAKRELKEESGYDVQHPERWFYMGEITTSKLIKGSMPCFAVDVTGLKMEEKEGDGSMSEDKSEFKMASVKEALESDDSLVPALFMKMFKYIFKYQSDETPIGIYDLKKKLDAKFLVIDGVNGSLVRQDDGFGNQYIEYTVKEITDNIKNSIPTEAEGIKIVVTEVKS